jgi:hypothetical protein
MQPMTPFEMPSLPLPRMLDFMFFVSKFMYSHHLPLSLYIGGLVWCSP